MSSGNNNSAEKADKIINWSDESCFSNTGNETFSDSAPLVEFKIPVGHSKMLVLFGKHGEQVKTHSFKLANATRGTVFLCKEKNCPLCACGDKVYMRALIPVFSVESGEVEVFPFMVFTGVNDLYPQMKHFILQPEMPTLLRVHRADTYVYNVQRGGEVPTSSLDVIKAKSEAFMGAIKDGTLDMSRIFNEIDNHLLYDSNLQRKLSFKGHDYTAFLTEEKGTFEDEEFVM